MPITVSWYDDRQQVILQRYDGRWSWQELSMAAAKVREMTGAVPHSVILFVDMSNSNQIPQGNVLSYGRDVFNMMPRNMVHIVVAAQSQVIEVFANLVIQMLPMWRNRVQFAKTAADADRMIAAVLDSRAAGSES